MDVVEAEEPVMAGEEVWVGGWVLGHSLSKP